MKSPCQLLATKWPIYSPCQTSFCHTSTCLMDNRQMFTDPLKVTTSEVHRQFIRYEKDTNLRLSTVVTRPRKGTLPYSCLVDKLDRARAVGSWEPVSHWSVGGFELRILWWRLLVEFARCKNV